MASSTVFRTSNDESSNKRRRVMEECIPYQASSNPSDAVTTTATTTRSTNRQNRSNTNESIVYQEGFPKLLLETLQSENGVTAANGLTTLASKIKDITSAQELKEFFALGGHVTVSILMRKFWPDESINQTIQTMGCCCIARMIGRSEYLGLLLIGQNGQAYTNDNRDVQTCSSCLATCHLLRVLELVVIALKDYPQSKDLQKFGSAALNNLLLIPGKPHQYAKQLVEELGGVQIMVQAMTRFPMEEMIQSLGISFLHKLCRLGMGKAPVLKTKALAAVAYAVGNFPDNQAMTNASLSFMTAVLSPP